MESSPATGLSGAGRRRHPSVPDRRIVGAQHHRYGSSPGQRPPARSSPGYDDLRAALAAVGADWAENLPDGLDTTFGENHELDGAQAQQLTLARVVLADPHTVILDEATALLDPSTARNTERALAAVLRNRTVIAIAHRLQTAQDADRIVVMDAGLVTEVGSHDELVRKNGAYAALWQSWHGVPDGARVRPQ